MYSMLSDDGKESNTAKVVNIASEFNEFRDTLFNTKESDTKWKEFKVKNTNLVHMKSKNIIIVFWWQKVCFKPRYLYAPLFS